ncbi:hypothetical protein DRO02_07460 [archaeon]|nr:MAG: hypothetical protein DRO02_07460 [archaeon]
MEPSRKPLNVLSRSVNSYIIIKLKDGLEYRGVMTQCDGYMNIVLEGATEYLDGQPSTNYGNVFIRGNNILYIILDAKRQVPP